MSPEPAQRRPVYFAFQGLFMAVLLLLFLYQPNVRRDAGHLSLLLVILTVSVVFLRVVPDRVLTRWWFHAGLFIGDVGAAGLILGWTGSQSSLFLIYLLIVFGSALTRSLRQHLIVAGVTITLYLVSGWRPSTGWPSNPDFWLRTMFLAISSALMSLLAHDSRRAQDEQRRLYEERLVQVGRLATLGRIAGEVAHRIKGPLTTIAVNAEVLAHRPGMSPETLKELEEIGSEVGKCKAILKDLLDLGRIEEMDVAAVDLRAPLRAALKSIETQARRRSVGLAVGALDHALMVRGDSALLQEAFFALLQNALEAVPDSGHIRVSAQAAANAYRVEIVDDGAGISSVDLERIFEPFYTTKKELGSGLGLSSALRIAAKHGGMVEVESEGPGRGARFSLVIPAA